VLRKIKKQARYEKLYNRALRKMRLLNGNKEYKRDSCLPVYTGGTKSKKLSVGKMQQIDHQKSKDDEAKLKASNHRKSASQPCTIGTRQLNSQQVIEI